MESFNLNENLIVGDDYFIFDDEVSSSSLSDTDQSYTDSEGEQETAALPLVLESQMPSFFQAVKVQENKPIVAPTSTTISSRIQSALVAYLKPAKGREDQYTAGDFPISLLCNPYKYDLKLVGEICASKSTPMNISDLLSQSRQVSQEENDFLVVSLVDSETMTTPTLATGATPIKDKKDYLSVESITKVNQRERVVRFTFNLCSFHVKRRSFRLVVQNKNTGENVFVSSPFKTFARRRDHTTTSSGNSRQAYHQSLMNNMYFMQESKLKSRRAAPYPQVPQTKMNRFSPTAQSSIVVTTPENGSKTPVQQQQQPSTQPQMYAPMAMYAMNGYMYNGYQSGFTYPIESLLQNLGPQERTSLAIQLMSSLTPVERETVDFYLSCSGQCFAMNAPKQEQTNPCCFQMPTSGQSQVNSRV